MNSQMNRILGLNLKYICVVVIIATLGCEPEPPELWDGEGAHVSMGFESSREPFDQIPNRPVDEGDTSNGCYYDIPWNDLYVFNVCVATTREISDFTIERSNQYARTGLASCKFMLKPTPLADWPIGEATHRAELGPKYELSVDVYPRENEERWYGLSVLFPDDFIFAETDVAQDLRFSVAEWQHGSMGSPILSLEVIGDKIVLVRKAGESQASEWVGPVEITSIEKEKWIDIVVRTVWSKTNGVVEIWINGENRFTGLDLQTIYHDLEVGGGYKFGINHWRWKDKDMVEMSLNEGITERTIYIDEVKEYLGADGIEEVSPDL